LCWQRAQPLQQDLLDDFEGFFGIFIRVGGLPDLQKIFGLTQIQGVIDLFTKVLFHISHHSLV
jgi:hypothetical protein